MAKLVGLGIENFRVFKAYTEFDFAPITLLTGANNSGKSSLIKALLLLAVNAEKNLEKFKLDFEADSNITKLGEFNSVCHTKKKDIAFKLFFENLWEAQIRPIHHTDPKNDLFKKIAKNRFKIDFSFGASKQENMTTMIFSIATKNINFIELFNFKFDNNAKSLSVKVDNLWLEKFIYNSKKLEWTEGNTNFLNKIKSQSIFKDFGKLEDIIELAFDTSLVDVDREELRRAYHFSILDNILKKLVDIAFKTIQFGDKIEYLPAFRGSQERFYDSDINLPLNKLLKQFTDKKFTENSKEKKYINFWINELGIGKGIEFKPEDGGTRVNIINGSGRPMADYGFGITQYLPLLLKIVLNPNKILIIEEGENSLHPNFQSLLADLLIDAKTKFGIHFIVETHSEYLILKLQYLTVKKEISVNDTAIYYFNDLEKVPEGKKQVERISIQEDGELDQEFGKGFSDESARLIGNIWKAANL